MAQVLLGCGAKLETRNKDGNTPLWLAGLHDRLDVAGALITAGADKEAKDEVGVDDGLYEGVKIQLKSAGCMVGPA